MSIQKAQQAAAVSSPFIPQHRDQKASTTPAPYARAQRVNGSDGPPRVAHAQPVPPTPFKGLARAICNAGAEHHQRLVNRGVSNPTYLGSDRGAWSYYNVDNGEFAVRNFNVRPSILGLANYNKTLLAKSDGRIILDGEILTKDHPDAPRVLAKLEGLLQKISEDNLPRRSFIGGNTLLPPWEPGSASHHLYVS
ncbi:MAG: hypothetical protein JWQ41_3198 [Variovorax sp.]|nr:hypothetical protein [Variovorax sp.]